MLDKELAKQAAPELSTGSSEQMVDGGGEDTKPTFVRRRDRKTLDKQQKQTSFERDDHTK